jgi:hypothetical protein
MFLRKMVMNDRQHISSEERMGSSESRVSASGCRTSHGWITEGGFPDVVT